MSETDDKKFTQAELDAVVQERLAREKTKHENELKPLQTQLTEYETKNKELSAKVVTVATEANQTVKEVLTGLLEGIPEENKGLIPEKYSDAEKVKYIQQNKTKLFGSSPPAETPPEKPQSPPSPQDKLKTEAGKTTIPAGYKNLLDWSLKDPKGFQEAEKKGLV